MDTSISGFKPVKIGILGVGRIAEHMGKTLSMMRQEKIYTDLIEPYAVASRSADRAQSFAKKYNLSHAYNSYRALLSDDSVDLIYIATPHSFHAQQAKDCLNANKHVLVEKSFCLNSAQAQDVIDLAQQQGLLCAEAIWTRYMPSRRILTEILASEQIGKVRAATANLCYPTTYKTRITDPGLGGGALLDVGVYALNFLDTVFAGKQPQCIKSTAVQYRTGVDECNNTVLVYSDGAMGMASSSISVASDRTGSVWADKGYLVCHNINNIESIDIYDTNHQKIQHIQMPTQLTGYEYEVAAAAKAIQARQTECPEMTHADTLRIMQLMDTIRAQW